MEEKKELNLIKEGFYKVPSDVSEKKYKKLFKYACSLNYSQPIVISFLKFGMDPNAGLIPAIENNCLNILKILMRKKANVLSRLSSGITVFEHAIYQRNVDALKILLRNDAKNIIKTVNPLERIIDLLLEDDDKWKSIWTFFLENNSAVFTSRNFVLRLLYDLRCKRYLADVISYGKRVHLKRPYSWILAMNETNSFKLCEYTWKDLKSIQKTKLFILLNNKFKNKIPLKLFLKLGMVPDKDILFYCIREDISEWCFDHIKDLDITQEDIIKILNSTLVKLKCWNGGCLINQLNIEGIEDEVYKIGIRNKDKTIISCFLDKTKKEKIE